jgi:aspartyl-tRNA(Asn)/glutamyl-tRNA(Gln) amidotransferase subunit C
MSLDAQKVRHIAKLARIRLTDEEVVSYTHELSSIFKWIEELAEVADDGTVGVASVCEHTLPMREDVVNDGEIVEQILANAPASDYHCFVVPKVIDQG